MRLTQSTLGQYDIPFEKRTPARGVPTEGADKLVSVLALEILRRLRMTHILYKRKKRPTFRWSV